ncbi:Integrator complex subunit like [Heracleum sosnowskyi]|uniref:Integrator complex subunit like n=1 Tax=Heracleum sosnowskyi TaxID=360622 RepID=A0AAD8MWQ1_9APIA|nr:Integrator complex subunit like [Heracleum sosnowskyi]
MGQALRRASGRLRSSAVDKSPAPPIKTTVGPTPPAVPSDKVFGDSAVPNSVQDGASKINADNMLEEKDPQYDAMLSQMVGRIQSKSGGKSEMGEAFVVERYSRPTPKLRSTKTGGTDRYEERPAPSGTLNISQIRQIVQLHQGKSADHNGPMNIQQIAEKFRIDAAHVERILQYISLPPEDNSKQKKNQQ